MMLTAKQIEKIMTLLKPSQYTPYGAYLGGPRLRLSNGVWATAPAMVPLDAGLAPLLPPIVRERREVISLPFDSIRKLLESRNNRS